LKIQTLPDLCSSCILEVLAQVRIEYTYEKLHVCMYMGVQSYLQNAGT